MGGWMGGWEVVRMQCDVLLNIDCSFQNWKF
jgi:hypothetical protein